MKPASIICRCICITLVCLIWPNALVEWMFYFHVAPTVTASMLLVLALSALGFLLDIRSQGRRFTKAEKIWLVVTGLAVIHPILNQLIPDSLLFNHVHSGALYPALCDICVHRVGRMYILPWSMATLWLLLSRNEKPRKIAAAWDILCLAAVPLAIAITMQILCWKGMMGNGTTYPYVSPYCALNSGGGVVFVAWAAVRPLLFLLDRFLLWYKTRRQTTSNILKET